MCYVLFSYACILMGHGFICRYIFTATYTFVSPFCEAKFCGVSSCVFDKVGCAAGEKGCGTLPHTVWNSFKLFIIRSCMTGLLLLLILQHVHIFSSILLDCFLFFLTCRRICVFFTVFIFSSNKLSYCSPSGPCLLLGPLRLNLCSGITKTF
jgi:hypothetical protein